uniref:Guanylate cyclase n=1 Tax=Strongyloides papillosus TaxID=174720 RepID=A0A0N5B6W7_STREA
MRFSFFVIFIFFVSYVIIKTNERVVKIGFLFNNLSGYYDDKIGFTRSAGMAAMALKRIRDEQLLSNITNITVYYKFENCNESNASALSYNLSYIDKVHVIFGPSCTESVKRASFSTQMFNTQLFVWGIVSSSKMLNHKKYPNVYSSTATFYSLSYAALDFIESNNWTDIAFLSTPSVEKRCNRMFTDFQTIMDNFYPSLNLKSSLITETPPRKTDFDYFFDSTKPFSRIIVSCFDMDVWKRDFLLYMYDNNFTNNEWVHINLEIRRLGFPSSNYDENNEQQLFYKDVYGLNDKRNDDAFKMAKHMFIIDSSASRKLSSEFIKETLNKIKDWPFYCSDCVINNTTQLSLYASYLYDAVYFWATFLNISTEKYGEEAVFNNFSLLKFGCNRTIEGVVGTVIFDSECNRLAIFQVKRINRFGEEVIHVNYSFDGVLSFNKTMSDVGSNSTMFENWDNSVPLNRPLCGYSGKNCPIDFFKEYRELAIIIIVVIIILIIISILSTVYAVIRYRRKALEELSKWKIPNNKLTKRENNDSQINQSSYSFHSGRTSKSSRNITTKEDSNRFMYVNYETDLVVAERHTVMYVENKEDLKELSEIFLSNHSNINKFYGMSVDGSFPLSVWRYCKRGSIFDILQTDTSLFDSFFLMCLIKDIVEGLHFIHKGFIKFHGQLTSKNCLVNDRWEVKISNFDLKSMRIREKVSNERKLWMAPEHLRDDGSLGSSEGDIYSFAIICSEIICKTTPFNIEMEDDSIDETVYFVKRNSLPPKRPELVPYEGIEINSALLLLIKDCWNELPQNRPNIKDIKKVMTAISDKKKKNLMDHAFSILETYAGTLSEEVQSRTSEIIEEQKKSDLLLKRMLPSTVAEKLKLGKAIEPENFDSVTVFFADVVKFTILSSKCSPLQVIGFVNDLFTTFDNIIESLDVYKVETIGDGYLCVSGLPIPNGMKHAKEIALLALGFINACNKFKIASLPDEKITVRVGCNSGPCVAGVVGLSMPRYCLFGDTINTASRMESNGKPGRIHTTESYYKLLTQLGGFDMKERGSVIIKGKGVMTTYWLNGIIGDPENFDNIYQDDDVIEKIESDGSKNNLIS